ncbi:MAG: hypothetical protein KAU28_11395, partial [Phycisphaerae bacterium]|nr:hypothetical protein [Phycisphaerae bacterium]
MIDVKLIRAEPAKYIEAARVKNIDADIPALLEVDSKLSDARRELQDIRTAQNTAGKEIAALQGGQKQAAIDKMSDLKSRLKELNGLVAELEQKFNELMLLVAQPPAADVPIGADEGENVTIRTEGKI